MSRRLFRKNDRVRMTRPLWRGVSTGTIIENEVLGNEVKFHVDGFTYQPNDWHSLDFYDLAYITQPRLFKKGDRVEIHGIWSSPKAGIVLADESEGEIPVRVDNYGYSSPTDQHRFPFTKLVLVGQPASLVSTNNGCICVKCNTKNEWAEPNQSDGKYLCFECR